ncbi:Pal1 cell morphology [Moelleriella libera RCEF 2490]|uniref:Pal1 cell morphology n=1 Tax=Moelleriella libera RCEF 2490 TaxID=1081109 RepID=A0A162I8T8_9HYPO|nr:Pal1 cell morphology [Moelleriella libera RCEF 2490]
MSHRPLDMIKRDARAADRPIRQRKGICETDMIDSLDTVGGGPYHHGGPYDATLISRNLSKKYSPVAAVQRSNLEALRATPRENIVDSLTKHVPLQGTSTIPPGARDMSGRVMHYKEGADLMREPDAPGGAYKRWDHGVQYHPDDLKGKGEPSFTIERELKKGKGHRHHQSDPTEFEMHPVSRHSKQALSRQRSISQTGEASSSDARRVNDSAPRRRNTTGKTLSEGLKKRFAGSRRKNDAITEVAH